MDEPDVGALQDRQERVFPSRRTLRGQRTPGPGSSPWSSADAAGTSSGAVAAGIPGSTDASTEGTEGTTDATAREPLPGGRRDRRRQETAQMILATDAGDHAEALRAGGTDNPFRVDGKVLAQQKALAERAAALTARARRIKDLSEQYRRSQGRPAPDDPTSMRAVSIVVTPDVAAAPGDGTALLRAPMTSGLPVVESRDGNGGPIRVPAVPPASIPQSASTEDHATGTGPIEARSAFGLDPLDAVTAGLGRARRVRLLQYSLAGVGGAALLTGIMMIVSSLNG